jgi:hypothetical protein
LKTSAENKDGTRQQKTVFAAKDVARQISKNTSFVFYFSKGFRVYALAQWERAGIGATFPNAAIPQSPSLISGTVADHHLLSTTRDLVTDARGLGKYYGCYYHQPLHY